MLSILTDRLTVENLLARIITGTDAFQYLHNSIPSLICTLTSNALLLLESICPPFQVLVLASPAVTGRIPRIEAQFSGEKTDTKIMPCQYLSICAVLCRAVPCYLPTVPPATIARSV